MCETSNSTADSRHCRCSARMPARIRHRHRRSRRTAPSSRRARHAARAAASSAARAGGVRSDMAGGSGASCTPAAPTLRPCGKLPLLSALPERLAAPRTTLLAPSVDPLETGLSPARNACEQAFASPWYLSVRPGSRLRLRLRRLRCNEALSWRVQFSSATRRVGIIRRMTAPDEWLRIESLDLEAQGVAHNAEGKVVFVEDALPGEEVRVASCGARTVGAGGAGRDAPRERAAGRAALPALRRLRRLQDAAPARRARRSRPSSARSRTRSGISARSRPSACCGRSRGRPGATGSGRGSRCATWPRRARCWSASTSASRASSPTSRSCDVLPQQVSDLLLPLRALIGAMATRDRLPQIELAVGDDATALVLRHLEPLPDDDLERLRALRARARRRVVAAAARARTPRTARRRRVEARLHAARVRHPHAVPADRLHAGQPRRSTRRWCRARCGCSTPQPRERVDRLVLRPRQLHACRWRRGRRRCSASKAARRWSRGRATPRRCNGLAGETRFAERNLFEIDAATSWSRSARPTRWLDRSAARRRVRDRQGAGRSGRRSRRRLAAAAAHRLRQLQPGDAGARRRPAGAPRRLPLHGGGRGQHVPAHGARREHRRLRPGPE